MNRPINLPFTLLEANAQVALFRCRWCQYSACRRIDAICNPHYPATCANGIVGQVCNLCPQFSLKLFIHPFLLSFVQKKRLPESQKPTTLQLLRLFMLLGLPTYSGRHLSMRAVGHCDLSADRL